jgi:hypothetical protein
MYQWGVRFLTIFNGNKTRDVIKAKFPKNMNKELIIETLKNIGKFMEDLQSHHVYHCLFRATPKR